MSFVNFPEFPNSSEDPFLITSVFTPAYNCIAWAFGDNTRWYWPDPSNIYYWPENIPREINLDAFTLLFSSINYEICTDGELDGGYEKIAIFVDKDNIPTHAARQLRNGFWTSKLGPNIDIQHSIISLEGGNYGMVAIYMQRENINT